VLLGNFAVTCLYLNGGGGEVRGIMSDGRYRQVGHGAVGSKTANRDMADCRFLDVIEYEHLSLRCVSS